MEEKNNLKENLEKGKNNKKKIIIFVTLGIILLSVIIFLVVKNNLDSNNNKNNNKDNELIDNNKDKDNNKYMALKVKDTITFNVYNDSEKQYTKVGEYKCINTECSLEVGIQELTINDNDNGIYGINDNKKLVLYNVDKGVVGTYLIDGTLMYDEQGNAKYLYIKSIDNGKYGIVDLNGNVIKDFNIDYYNNLYSSSSYWYSIKDDTMINYKDGKYGITKITSDDILVDYTIDEIKLEKDTYFEGRTGDEWKLYYINSGKQIAALTTKKYDISEDNLYVSTQEKKYSNYKRDKKVVIDENNEYYIENNKLYFKNNDEIEEVNLNGETPKYLALGTSCGGIFIGCLTTEGNIFVLNNVLDKPDKVGKLYNKNDAKEFLLFTESWIFDTCGGLSLYAVTNDDKLLYVTEQQDNYKTREEVHPYSLAFNTNKNGTGFKIVLYPNGTIDKYMYIYSSETEYNYNKEFINVNNKELLVSYIFIVNDKVYIIDTNGIIYEVTNINDESDDKVLVKLEKSNVINEKIKYVEVLSYIDTRNYRYENIEVTYKVKQITLYGENGKKVEMIK